MQYFAFFLFARWPWCLPKCVCSDRRIFRNKMKCPIQDIQYDWKFDKQIQYYWKFDK